MLMTHCCLINTKGKVVDNVHIAKGQGQPALPHKKVSNSNSPISEGKIADILVYKPAILCTWGRIGPGFLKVSNQRQLEHCLAKKKKRSNYCAALSKENN